MKDYLIDAISVGDEEEYGFDGRYRSVKEAREDLKEMGYKVTKIVPRKKNHRCRYCEEITEGSYEDLLCEECRSLFGHSLYSEL